MPSENVSAGLAESPVARSSYATAHNYGIVEREAGVLQSALCEWHARAAQSPVAAPLAWVSRRRLPTRRSYTTNPEV